MYWGNQQLQEEANSHVEQTLNLFLTLFRFYKHQLGLKVHCKAQETKNNAESKNKQKRSNQMKSPYVILQKTQVKKVINAQGKDSSFMGLRNQLMKEREELERRIREKRAVSNITFVIGILMPLY